MARSHEELCTRLREVFERVRAANIRFKPSKCVLGTRRIDYLGHSVTAKGVKPLKEKIQAVADFQLPSNKKELHSFVGLCQYYRRFVQDFAVIAAPLTDKLSAKAPDKFAWTSEMREAFYRLKKELCSEPILRLPDFSKTFILKTDASDRGVGGVLVQEDADGTEHPVLYVSRKFNATEEKSWWPTEKEAFALYWCVKTLRPYLDGRHFIIKTDHSALKYIKAWREINQKVQNWSLLLQDMDFEVRHKKGKLHRDADAISRLCAMAAKACGCTEEEWRSMVNTIEEDFDEMPEEGSPLSADILRSEASAHWPSDEEIITLQRNDEELGQTCEYLTTGKEPSDEKIARMVRSGSYEFSLIDRKLFRIFRAPSRGITPCLVVPPPLREKVLYENHGHVLAGHLGLQRTVSRISLRYWWRGMYDDIKRWVMNCPVCRAARQRPTTHWPLKPIPVTRAFELVGMDIVGPLPESHNGNRYMLVFMDYLTKWPEVFPMKDMTALAVAECLAWFVAQHSVPKAILIDQGSQLKSKELQKICDVYGIHHKYTTPAHPETDGLVERFNQTLVHQLKKLVDMKENRWEKYLPYVLFAYRVTTQQSTNHTRFEMVMGRQARLPGDQSLVAMDMLSGIEPEDYVEVLREGLEILHKEARENIAKQQEKMAQKSAWAAEKLPRYEIGQMVRLHLKQIPKGTSSKFALPWRAIFRVVDGFNNGLNYRIQPLGGQQVMNVHVSRLAPAYKSKWLQESPEKPESFKQVTIEHRPTAPANVLDETDTGEVWEVQEILDMRTRRDGRRDYLVKWNLLPRSLAEWIPEEQLFCPKLCSDFERRKRMIDAKKQSERYVKAQAVAASRAKVGGLDFTETPRLQQEPAKGKQPTFEQIKVGQVLLLFHPESHGIYYVNVLAKDGDGIEARYLPKSSKVEVEQGKFRHPAGYSTRFSRRELEKHYTWRIMGDAEVRALPKRKALKIPAPPQAAQAPPASQHAGAAQQRAASTERRTSQRLADRRAAQSSSSTEDARRQ
ncbi:unnamed protein product [Vitrella brassicaformis CCMP3155]|uniref:Integrase catalytic domain-containing protein n=1 Tax=Vitrella brassicaformis (strain CCMP3155) TaxID=1169540 RepID=A0A0G4GQ00_VITBC|nr:unnamed protein product [Vitrella brassicaformis CCMP3155]|eukprot:CEM32443.1 unnamed protein product [Vitrella brassicaformis CCMP3155]